MTRRATIEALPEVCSPVVSSNVPLVARGGRILLLRPRHVQMGRPLRLQAWEDRVFSRASAGLAEEAGAHSGLPEPRTRVHRRLAVGFGGKDPVLGDNVLVVHGLEPLLRGAHVRLVVFELAQLSDSVASGRGVYAPYPAREVDAFGELDKKHLHRLEDLRREVQPDSLEKRVSVPHEYDYLRVVQLRVPADGPLEGWVDRPPSLGTPQSGQWGQAPPLHFVIFGPILHPTMTRRAGHSGTFSFFGGGSG